MNKRCACAPLRRYERLVIVDSRSSRIGRKSIQRANQSRHKITSNYQEYYLKHEGVEDTQWGKRLTNNGC